MKRAISHCLVAITMVLGACASPTPPASSGRSTTADDTSHTDAPYLTPLVDDSDRTPAAWRWVGLPRQTKPFTTFTPIHLDGHRVVKVRSTRAYGKLAHRVPKRAERASQLQWSWRVDHTPQGDLRVRDGEDAALKVCASFDWPMERLPTLDRVRLDTARSLFGDELPTAALCYVWHPNFEPGTVIVSPYTRRLRMVVVDGYGKKLGLWSEQRRDLHADFKLAFADEWKTGDTHPPLLDVLVGGDADNTGAEGLGYLRALKLSMVDR